MRGAWRGIVGVAGLVAAGCAAAAPPPGAPRADRAAFPAAGSTWVVTVRHSGSFQLPDQRVTLTALGEQTWQGRPVHASRATETTFLFDAATGGLVARLRGATPTESWDPPLAWRWPIWVGKSWPLAFTYRDHLRGQTFTVQGWVTVEAHEEVTVPAGRFRAFRVVYADEGTEVTAWWSPELGLTVKEATRRGPRHHLGPGTRDLELVSHDLRR